MKTTVAFALAAVAAIGCSDSPVGPGGGGGGGGTRKPTYLALEPPHVTTSTHFPVQFTLVLRDSAGVQVLVDTPTTQPTWSVDDTAIAAISASGSVSKLRPGLTKVRATWGGITGFAVLQVLPNVAHLAVSPTASDAYFGAADHLTAIPSDSNNVPIDRFVSWRSSDTTIATVNDSGAVSVRQAGTVSITASADLTFNSATVRAHTDKVTVVTITAPGGANAASIGSSLKLSATLTGQVAPTTSGFPITWTSADTTRARVDQGGLVTPVALGSTTIFATAGGVSDSFPLRIDPHVASVVLVPDTLQVTVGGGARGGLVAVAKDSTGHPLPGHLIKFAVKDSTLTPFVDSVTITAARPGSTTLYATADGVRDSGVVLTDTLSLQWLPNGGVTMDVGDPRFGAELVGPALTQVSIRSSDTTVVQINAGDTVLNTVVGMHLDPRRPGVSVITAQAPGFAPVGFRANVYAPELVGFVIGPRPGPLTPGDTERLSASEAGHTAELYYPVTWTSSDTTVATVDTGGLIRARAPGRAGIFGTAHGRADTVRLYVRAPSAPLLVSLSDSAVNAGDTLKIAGAGLGSPGIDTVWIAGVPSMITSAADTQIVAVVPAATQYSCASPGPVSLRVTVGREFRDTLVSLTVAPTATLAVGDVLRLTGAPARCLSFPVLSGSYLVGVANTAAVTKSFELQVDSAGRQQVPPPPNWPTALRSGSRGPQTADGQSPLGLTRIISERMRGVIHSLRMQQRGGPRAAMTGPTMAPPTFFPGATTVLKVPVLDAPDPCSTFSQVQARVVYAGAHVVMMEDADAPLAGQMDPVITSVGTDLDGHAFSVLATNLGNPLAAFPGGKMVVLMTPQANAYGTDAFSAGCDFYAPSVAPSSNQEPVIYAAVPTDPGTGYSAFTAQAWAWAVPASLVNLGAHLTTFGVRLAAGAPPEQAWLDEAIAEATVEIWDRQYSGVVWKENAGYQASLYCEVRPTFPSCTGHPFAMFGAFETLYQYDLAAPARSPLGGAPGDFTFPAGAWWLLRTTIDHYASTESGFLSALVHEPSLTGLANLTARAGAPAGTVLADWMVYSYGAGDPNFGALPASLTTGSWDSHNIFSGMHNDFPQQFGFFPLSPMPLGGVQTFYGGGAAIGQFGVGVPTAEALGLTSPAGGVADPAVFLTIVRVY